MNIYELAFLEFLYCISSATVLLSLCWFTYIGSTSIAGQTSENGSVEVKEQSETVGSSGVEEACIGKRIKTSEILYLFFRNTYTQLLNDYGLNLLCLF